MDILVIVILMAVLYLIPELLRKKRNTQYEYPSIPEKNVAVAQRPVVTTKREKDAAPLSLAVQTIPGTIEAVVKVREIGDAKRTWKNFNQAGIVTGFVFSQILQPPRAHRPFYYKKKL